MIERRFSEAVQVKQPPHAPLADGTVLFNSNGSAILAISAAAALHLAYFTYLAIYGANNSHLFVVPRCAVIALATKSRLCSIMSDPDPW